MKLSYILSLITWLFLSNTTVSASHVMGSEIEYQCIGNGKYNVVIRVYRDCNGIQVVQSDLIARSGTTTLTISNQTKVSTRDITGIDPNCPIQSRCTGSTYQYGIEEHVWSATVDLNMYTTCEWVLSWEQCCRNGNITTGQASQNFFTTAMLNKCLTPCNSSPTFTIAPTPVAIICYNQDIVFNNGALDTIDSGDSLSYELVNGLTGLTSSVTYSGNFSPVRPMTFFGFPNQNLQHPAGFHLDPVTGDLAFRPTSVNQVAIIVIEVKEWRKINGTMQVIGKTRRDMQVIVSSCSGNKSPKISGPFHYDICVGSPLCIPIVVTDDNATDTVRISWNQGIPDAAFTHTNGLANIPQGEICWTPDSSDVSSIPYTFTITAKDNACPIAGTSIKNFSVTVNPYNTSPQAILDIDLLDCREVAIDHTTLATYPGYMFSYTLRDIADSTIWTSQIKQDTLILDPGNYYIELYMDADSNCPNTIHDSFTVSGHGNMSATGQVSVCDGDSVFIAPGFNIGVPQILYDWYEINASGQSGLLATASQLSVIPAKTTSYVGIANVGNCILVDTTLVSWSPVPIARFAASLDTVCLKNASIQFSDSSTLTFGAIVSRDWDFGDGTMSGARDPYHQFLTDSNFVVKLITASDSGCLDSVTHPVLILPTPVLAPVQHQLGQLRGSNAGFSVGNVHSLASYQWQLDSGQGFVNLSNSGQFSGANSYQLTVTNVQLTNNNTIYRCIVSLGNCTEMSTTGVLSVTIGTGVEAMPEAMFRIYPNPTDHVLNIEFHENQEPAEITIINSAGSKVYSTTVDQNITALDVSLLPKGVYFIMLNEERNKSILFIKE